MQKIFGLLGRVLPNSEWANGLLASRLFYKVHGRFPRGLDDPKAAANDYVFWRMIRNEWSPLELACIDKETAKQAVLQWGDIKSAKTHKVMHVKDMGYEDFCAQIRPYIGQNLVAKPTQGSGIVIFLKKEDAEKDFAELYKSARRNFFYANRESQYDHLEPKVIIEEDISDSTGKIPDDFKFHASKGHLIYCQHDLDRFGDHRRAIISTPEFGIMDEEVSWAKPIKPVTKPLTWDKMLQFAQTASQNFEYVRVDLYEIDGEMYFGEMTFTPGAGMGDVYFNPAFERHVLNQIRRS